MTTEEEVLVASAFAWSRALDEYRNFSWLHPSAKDKMGKAIADLKAAVEELKRSRKRAQ